MAMQLRTISNKVFNPTLNLVRYQSRSLPSIFWEDPFRRHRQLMSEFWNSPSPFDTIAPIERFMRYRMPPINYLEGEEYASNPKDGFQVSLNVEHFEPNEINVKVIDNSVLVEAKHEERAESGESYVSRHFTKRYVLSDEFNIKDIVSTLSSDGILTVRVPPKEIDPKNARNIHIEHTGAPARSLGQGSGTDRLPDKSQAPEEKEKENPNDPKKN